MRLFRYKTPEVAPVLALQHVCHGLRVGADTQADEAELLASGKEVGSGDRGRSGKYQPTRGGNMNRIRIISSNYLHG